MVKQAETDYSKSSKEMAQQEQKIEKANTQIQKEAAVQQNLKQEKTSVEKEIHVLGKESNEFENVINGYKENLRLAKEGKFKSVNSNSGILGRGT